MMERPDELSSLAGGALLAGSPPCCELTDGVADSKRDETERERVRRARGSHDESLDDSGLESSDVELAARGGVS